MTSLHIKALSGPRPVTAAAVRTLLAENCIGNASRVLSLDRGQTWIPVAEALAVCDGEAVADRDIDRALRPRNGLHPLAMPAGVAAGMLLLCGIAFGGGRAAHEIEATPAFLADTASEAAVLTGATAATAFGALGQFTSALGA